MFWNYTNSTSVQIEALLAKDDVTLKELLDNDDIINECKAQNKNLIDFLIRPENIEELVSLTLTEPSIDLPEVTRFKYANTATEVLTCDVPTINERLASDGKLLEQFYHFLEAESPLNPLLASYCSRILSSLIAKKSEQNWISYQVTCLQVIDFFKAKPNFVILLLKHVQTSAIMDFLLKLMTQVEGVEIKHNTLNWLDSQQLIQNLLSMLNGNSDNDKHHNVAQLLCDFIRDARDRVKNIADLRGETDRLLETMESSDAVNLLLNQIFVIGQPICESTLIGGINIMLALMDIHPASVPKFNILNIYNTQLGEDPTTQAHKQKMIDTTTTLIMKRLKEFQDVLLNPPKQLPVLTTMGLLDPPLGNTRLQIVRLFAIIVSITKNVKIVERFVEYNTINIVLDLFFQYPWNNFLHQHVEAFILDVLKIVVDQDGSQNALLCEHILVNCKLIERILGAWKESDEQIATKPRPSVRLGYMGHLIRIVNKMMELNSTTQLGKLIKEHTPDVWQTLEEFKDTKLCEINRIQNKFLAGVDPQVSVDEYDEFMPNAQTNVIQQQVYAQYQMQNLTPQMVEGYNGFNDDAFNDDGDTIQTMDNPAEVNFDLTIDETINQQEIIFKQICSQNINTLFDGDDQFFNDKEDEEDEDQNSTFRTVIEKSSSGGQLDSGGGVKYSAGNSSSDDEEEEEEDEDAGNSSGDDGEARKGSVKIVDMDVDPWTSPKPVLTDPDPWGNSESNSTDAMSSWADFSSVSFDTNFENVFDKKRSNVKPPLTETTASAKAADEQVPQHELPNTISDNTSSSSSCNSDATCTEGVAEHTAVTGSGADGDTQAAAPATIKEDTTKENIHTTISPVPVEGDVAAAPPPTLATPSCDDEKQSRNDKIM